MPTKTKSPVKYSIRVVAQKTGVNADTLRTWERRYNAVAPQRTPGGARYFDDESLARVHLLRQATGQGHAISAVAGLSNTELQRVVRGEGEARPGMESTARVQAALLAAVERLDLGEFERLVGTAALAFGVRELLDDVVQPFLREVGVRWEDGRMSIAQEHAVSSSLRSVMLALVRTYQRPMGAPVILLATLPGEMHEFGILMLQLLATSSGVSSYYLGPNVPLKDLVDTARSLGIQVIALSTINCAPAEQTRRELETLLQACDGACEVWIGGRCAEQVACALEHPGLKRFADLFTFEQRLQMMKN